MWQAYSGLLQDTIGAMPRYTFPQAKRAMADYIVAGMQAAPGDPTYTEQRDGILAAADAADPADFALLAAGFAARGAGVCAVSPARYSTDMVGVVESYDSGPTASVTDVSFAMVTECDNDGVLDGGEVGRYSVKIANSGWAALTGGTVTLTSTNPAVTFPNGPTVTIPMIARAADATVTIDVSMLAATMGIQDLGLSLDVVALNACTSTLNIFLGGRGNYDELAASSKMETFDGSGRFFVDRDQCHRRKHGMGARRGSIE